MTVRVSRLADRALIIMGQSPPGDTYNSDGVGTPLLNGPTEFGPIYPSEKQWTTAPTKLCQRGDILFCVRGATAGRTNIANKEYCLGRGLAAIRADEQRFDSRYLHHILVAGYANFQARGVGSTFINISNDQLSRFEVPLLPLSEQRRIAAILDQADELQGKRRHALILLDNLTRSLFVELFGDPASNPKKWPVKELGKIADFYAGTTLPSGEPFRDQKDGVLLTKVSDMNLPGNETELISCQLWSRIPGANAATCPKDAIIIPKRGGAIGTNKKRLTVRVSALDPNLMGIVGKPEYVDTAFLFQWFLEFDLTTLISGSSVPQLNKKDLAPLKIALPPLEYQRQFARQLILVTGIRASQRASLVKMQALLSAIQHRAFMGQLTSVNTASELEVAS